jgi:hypothetical protein
LQNPKGVPIVLEMYQDLISFEAGEGDTQASGGLLNPCCTIDRASGTARITGAPAERASNFFENLGEHRRERLGSAGMAIRFLQIHPHS